MDEDWSVLTRPAPEPDEVRRFGDLEDQVIDLWHAEGGENRPLVVIVHGGFWLPGFDRVHTRPQATGFREAGYDVASIEYRRQPGDPDVMVSDVAAALATFDRPVVLIGHSAGGHLVLWAAAAAPIPSLVGTIALAPVADLQLAHQLDVGPGAVAGFLGSGPENRPDLDPARLPTPATPVVIVHGTADEAVPLSLARSYAARHSSTTLVSLDEVGHFALIDPLSQAWPLILTELKSLGD